MEEIDLAKENFRAHCIFLIISWVLIPIAIYVTGRHLKYVYKYSIPLHSILSGIQFIISIIFFILASVKWHSIPKKNWSPYFHTYLNYIVMVLMIIEIVSGLALGYYRKVGKISEKYLQGIKSIHFWGGYLAFALGALDSWEGGLIIYLINEEKTRGYIQFAFCLFGNLCVYIITEIIFYFCFLKKKKNLSEMNYRELQSNENNSRKIMFYENLALDFSEYENLHPGNDNLLLDFEGMEISRYIYGGYPCGAFQSHPHTNHTTKLIKHLAFAKILDPISDLMDLPQKNDQGYFRFHIIHKKKITSKHFIIGFRKEGFRSRVMLPGFQHCGKYCTIESPYLNCSRNYSCTFSLSNYIFPHLINLYESFQNNKSFSSPFNDIDSEMKDSIEFCIKRSYYMSKFICDMDYESSSYNFGISGLYGPGISLSRTDSGTAVGIALGTGSILFIDWCSFLIRKIIAEKSNRKYLIFGNEYFNSYDFPNVKLKLFVSYTTKEEIFGLEIFEILKKLCHDFNIDRFELILRISSNGEERWNENFYKENIDLKETFRVYITTPPLVDMVIKKMMIDIGINTKNIVIL